MNAQANRQMTAEALGKFDIAALDGATSVATTRYQHGMTPSAIVAAAPKVAPRAIAPKAVPGMTPKAPTFN